MKAAVLDILIVWVRVLPAQQAMTDRCVTHLLPDDPTTHDVFGSHQRVASAIAELIKSEKVGKTVAITGSWGCGKSSVLRMVRQDLSQVADVFIFDAWAHEGDPLRRTFLERLIDFLWPDKPDQEVEQLKKDLLLRKKTKDDTATPVLTMEAKVVGLSLLMVPAGLAMFAAMVRIQKVSWDYLSLGLLLALLPIVILVLLTLGAGLRSVVLSLKVRISWRFLVPLTSTAVAILGVIAYRNRGPLISVLRLLLSHWAIGLICMLAALAVIMSAILRSTATFANIFPLLLNRTVTTSRSESVESVDPSSVEFQRWFASIVDIYKRSSKTNRLVIAIDNLDRVDPGMALQLWSTMRTFFEFDFDDNPWARCIWLLAAFDVNALRRLWPSSDGSAEAFVKKTFQISFAVPPLVLLKRDDFLLKQLRAAFPFHNDPQFQKVILLYGLEHIGEVSTPREITNFVNSVGSIHRQWFDDIPLVQQAQYVIAASASDGADVTNVLTAAAAPPESPEEIVGTDWRDALAAIHFSVPIADAAHVFMSGPLVKQPDHR
ncbi:MAG: KAP family NTPase [Acidobacteriia bacterium]|nr:KAP family NTPase [Terriglobia bacterium]